jgi:hypothetical protein
VHKLLTLENWGGKQLYFPLEILSRNLMTFLSFVRKIMIRKLHIIAVTTGLFFTGNACAWSWIEKIDNQSKYNVRIKNDSDHGKNYVKVINADKVVPLVGNMYQNTFLLMPGAQTEAMDGFAIAPSVGNKYVYIMVDKHAPHQLQELSDSDQVQIDGNPNLTAPGGQFKLTIKNASDVGDLERKNPLSFFDGNIFIALERIESKRWLGLEKLENADENQAALRDFTKDFRSRGAFRPKN